MAFAKTAQSCLSTNLGIVKWVWCDRTDESSAKNWIDDGIN
jgi:hypothetical protein